MAGGAAWLLPSTVARRHERLPPSSASAAGPSLNCRAPCRVLLCAAGFFSALLRRDDRAISNPVRPPPPAGLLPAAGLSTLLELRAVDGVRGGRPLFKALSLRVAGGELLRVQGLNGAGKTSLLRMICGLMAPAAGAICWRGQAIAAQRDDFNRELVYLGHAAALKDELSPRENLLAACTLGGSVPAPRDAAAALVQAGLRGRERLPSRMLSQGQRKRAALARLVLAGGSALWVLDEPFNALDVDATAWLLGLLQAQLARGGVVVLTSHQSVTLAAAVRQQVLTL